VSAIAAISGHHPGTKEAFCTFCRAAGEGMEGILAARQTASLDRLEPMLHCHQALTTAF
jgi:hypothetical protein